MKKHEMQEIYDHTLHNKQNTLVLSYFIELNVLKCIILLVDSIYTFLYTSARLVFKIPPQ